MLGTKQALKDLSSELGFAVTSFAPGTRVSNPTLQLDERKLTNYLNHVLDVSSQTTIGNIYSGMRQLDNNCIPEIINNSIFFNLAMQPRWYCMLDYDYYVILTVISGS